MVAYATREDVYLYGLPRGSLVARPRFVASVSTAANSLKVEGHGCSTATRIQLQAQGDGLLPAPLSSTVVYWAKPVDGSDSLLQLALTEGGAAVDLTTEGAEPFTLAVPIGPTLDVNLETFSRDVDSMIPAEQVPLVAPYPTLVVQYVAVLTAWSVASALGLRTQVDSLTALKDELTVKMLRFSKGGLPLRDARSVGSANLATGRSAAIPSQQGTIP